MNQFIVITLNGLTLGALYFLVASGFSLIFGLMRVVNLAHGSIYLFGAYIGWSVWHMTNNWLLALAAGPLAAAVLGLLLQQIILRRIVGQELREALVTIAASIIFADLLLWLYGGVNYRIDAPEILRGASSLGLVKYPTYRLFMLGFAIMVGVAQYFLLRTRLGMIIRAGIDDRQMVSALGINIELVSAIAFGFGALMAGLAGVINVTNATIAPGEDGRFLLSSLIVVIIGGMGRISGAALGALLVGLVEQYGLAYAPTYSVLITFALMILVLAVRPQGLLGRWV